MKVTTMSEVKTNAEAATVQDFEGQAEFFRKHATPNKNGDKHTLPRAASIEHFETHGFTREAVEAFKTAESAMDNGLTVLATQELVKNIAKARAAGEDPTGLKHSVSIPTLGGTTTVTVHAKKDRPNRFAKDEKGNPIEGARSIRFGSIDIDRDIEKGLAKGLPAAIASTIEAELNA